MLITDVHSDICFVSFCWFPFISIFGFVSFRFYWFRFVSISFWLYRYQNSGQCLGNRTIWKHLIFDWGLVIQLEKVMKLMRLINPDGIERQRRLLTRRQYAASGPEFGPILFAMSTVQIHWIETVKFIWNFIIYCAIYGFSKRITWLEVGPSHNSPKIVSRYFWNCTTGLSKYMKMWSLNNEMKEMGHCYTLVMAMSMKNVLYTGKAPIIKEVRLLWAFYAQKLQIGKSHF